MRKTSIRNFMRSAAVLGDEHGKPMETSMDFWVEFFGAGPAAWLVWKHKNQLHEARMVDFRVPANVQTPPWFRVGIETLKRRSKKWKVTMRGNPAVERVYRLEWLYGRHDSSPCRAN